MNKVVSRKITFFNSFGTFIILLHHCNVNAYFSLSGIRNVISETMRWISYPVMCVFFFFSGYLFFRKLDKSNILNKYKTRFWSLLVPYVLWNLVAYLFRIAAEGSGMNMKDVMLAFCFAYRPQEIHPCNTPTWYLMRLITFILIAPIVLGLYRYKKISLGIILSSFLVNLVITPNYYAWEYWAPVFCFGGWLTYWHKDTFETWLEGDKQSQSFWYLFLFIPLCIAGAWIHNWIIYESIHYIVRILSGGAVLWIVKHIPVESWVCGFMKSDLNFWIYCLHGVIINYIKHAILRLEFGYLVSYAFTFGVMVTMVCISWWLLKRVPGFSLFVGSRKISGGTK